MADSGKMEVVPVVGGEEQGTLILSKERELESPKFRRSERRKSSRSFSARGRLAKARPKSPLMRMVEMRKGGLRGRDLRILGLKGSGGSVSKASKGLKGSVGGGLVAIPECNKEIEGLEEGVGGKESAGGVSGEKELGFVGFSEQGDRRMEEFVGQDVVENSGCGGMEEDMGKNVRASSCSEIRNCVEGLKWAENGKVSVTTALLGYNKCSDRDLNRLKCTKNIG